MDSDLSNRFGDLVRRLRLAAAMSQEDLAHAAGLHATYVSRLERGLRMPSLLVVHKLAAAFGLTLTALMQAFEGAGGETPAA